MPHLHGNPTYWTDEERARKSGHAGAMADARRSVSVPAIYVSLALRAYDFIKADGVQRGTNLSKKVVMRRDVLHSL